MRRATKILLAIAAAALIYAPIDARADGYVSPWAGVNFAGGGLDSGRGSFGVQAGGMGGGIIGGEVDFGYSPSAFGTQNDFGNNSIINLMGNVIIGIPIGGTYGTGFRPFVTGGVGLIRTQMDGRTPAFGFHLRPTTSAGISASARWGSSTTTSASAETFDTSATSPATSSTTSIRAACTSGGSALAL